MKFLHKKTCNAREEGIMFKKIKRILGLAFLTAALTVGSAVTVAAEVDTGAVKGSFPVESDSWSNWPQAPENRAITACLMDLNTGAILYSKGMDAQRFPASITKIMTALVVVESADLNAQIAFTETGLADAYGGSSNINPQLGEVFTVDQMLQMLLIKSANDVATQLAEGTYGSVQAFADRMNQRAAELGCTNTHFTNASGLEDDNHYTSAHDMTLIMRAAISNNRIREIMNMQSIEIPETNLSPARYYETHLQMLVPGNQYYYEGAMGGKTGFTPISGCTLVMYATRGDRTLIGVIMGGDLDSNLICDDMADLLDYGFNSFAYTDMTAGYPFISGGTALLPAGMDPAAVEILPAETAEGVALTYNVNGQTMGSGLLAKDTYDTWQAALHPETKDTAEQGETVSEGSDQDHKQEKAEKKGLRTIGMYVAIAVLALSILACIILIVLTSERVQGKMRKNKQDHRRDR